MADLAAFEPPEAGAAAQEFGWTSGRLDGAYNSAGYGRQETAAWFADRGSADSQTLHTAQTTLARVRDLVRNDPTAGAALQRLCDILVGAGLRLSAHPDADALGIDPDAAHALGRQIQKEWRLFATDPRRECDAQRKLTMNGIFRLAQRTYLTASESTAVLKWRENGTRYATCIQLIDPDRLSQPYQKFDSDRMRGGVEMDSWYAPIAYHIREAHQGDWWAIGKSWTWTRVPRETDWGRPVFIHAYEPEREGQTRAVSQFASLVGRLRMLDRFTDAEIATATLNALFAAFIETDMPSDEVTDRLTAGDAVNGGGAQGWFNRVVDYFHKNPAMLGGSRIPVMPLGSKVTMNGSPRQTASFEKFERVFVNRIAARLGLPGELLTDFSQTNYSSMRAALNEMWRMASRAKAVFEEQFVQPIYFAFMEEAFSKGYLTEPKGAPSFDEMPGAYLRARWIGPGRGYVDPVKEAEAAALRMESMVSTLEMEAAEQGLDYEEVLDQIQREEQALKDRGLTRLSLVAAVQADKNEALDSEEADGPAGPGGQSKGKPS